jgi:uncharacterized protein (TIGR02117 family)
MKAIIKWFCALLLLLPVSYLLIALLLTYVTVNDEENLEVTEEVIYLKSNGIHLDIVLRSSYISTVTLDKKYVAVGWGDKDFYLKTPNFKDLTIATGVKALFLKSEALLHLTNYDEVKKDWVKIVVSKKQLKEISNQINEQFYVSDLTAITGYSLNDFFYKSKGSYSCFFTCNSWVNSILKNANLKACIWTPFSFRLLEIYQI